MCRGKEELRRRMRHPRHAAQIGEIVLLHVELRGNALHEHPLQRARSLCRLRQDNDICTEPLLKLNQTALQPEQHLRAAEDHEGKNPRQHSKRRGACHIPAAGAQGKCFTELHSFSPFRCCHRYRAERMMFSTAITLTDGCINV